MENTKRSLPMIPTRGITIFPNMVIHFDVGREKSIKALEEAMSDKQLIFLVSQKKAIVEDPDIEGIYKIGTVCYIKQILKLPGNSIRVLVEGKYRAEIIDYISEDPYYIAEVEEVKDIQGDENEKEALIRAIEEEFDEYIELSGNVAPDSIINLEELEESAEFADIVSALMVLKTTAKQELLEIKDLNKRLERILEILKNENEVLRLQKKIGTKVKKQIDKSQKEYYLREQMKIIQQELGEDDESSKEIQEYEKKIEKAKLPKEVKEKAYYELKRLKSTSFYSSESTVIRSYLDWIIELPWKTITKDNLDIKRARKILDEEHYGLEDVKERIIEYLAVRKISRRLNAPILCLVGPPGVGKTSIAKSIAHALDKKFVRMSLGGMKDEADIRGHRKTYVGAIPGRIIYGMKQAKSKNPLFLLDEIDKMSSNFKGDPADALLEVLDSQQNDTFRDHYIELDYDLSKVLFVVTANTLETIPRPLLDRMEVINVGGYTNIEKFHIAKRHLLKKVLEEHTIEDGKIKISDKAIKYIIEHYTKESGVRNLQRKIASVVRKAITEMVEKDKESVSITINHVKKYLGKEIYTYELIDKEDKVGIVTGLAWTAYGGDTLPVEVSVMEGSGKLQLTGKLGDVMQESAKAAYSLVRANAKKYDISPNFYKEQDIHIHVPEGAVPKDGPSAGITMTTALVSALSGKKVRHDVAMTGEITLAGRVLPIGGLKEKSLAAYRAGVKDIIIPFENQKDIDKIPDSVKRKVNFIISKNIDDVLSNALIKEKTNENN
ncbi:endopeptidase La [Oceanirhabdus sp. W0125-5]|uniref:endopeptidase La n=1 Tax=Oceanirhabdus sp. W0125-5 TaxID=2999116 RepID=UPI0022F2A829|nr:endopeptidase La [Oceanirhabdus sp. W0125-5]WBW98916.1 endopeptidase La [Oceanirhabdus sp. W0125-5]